jgi:hypothetical protein
MTPRENITARDFFRQVYGDTEMGAPTMRFAEEYHKEKIRRLLIAKYNKRRRVHNLVYTVNNEID